MASNARAKPSSAEAAGWRVLRWGFFVVAVSICPFVLVVLNVSDDLSGRWWFFQVWPHGELALIAFAIPADGLNECIFGIGQGRLWGRGGRGTCW